LVRKPIIFKMGIFDLFKKKSEEPDWVKKIPIEYSNLILNQIKSNSQACNLDEIPQGLGKFGLESTNPIPIYGIPSNEEYLHKLVLKNGNKIRWRREGSITISNISMPIDKYEIFDLEGNTVCFLFLSPYHLKTSQKVPEGFRFK